MSLKRKTPLRAKKQFAAKPAKPKQRKPLPKTPGSEDLDGEIWVRAIDPNYAVSNFGRVRRDQGGHGTRGAGHILKPLAHPCGYVTVGLYTAGRRTPYLVHRLVAWAFLGPRDSVRKHVHHINGDKADNRASNLAWVSPQENAEWAGLDGDVPRGEAHHAAKLTAATVIALRRDARSGGTHASLGLKYGVSASTVRRALSRESWAHVGDAG